MAKIKFEIVVEYPHWMTNAEDQLGLLIDVLNDGLFTTSNNEPYNDRGIVIEECRATEIKEDV